MNPAVTIAGQRVPLWRPPRACRRGGEGRRAAGGRADRRRLAARRARRRPAVPGRLGRSLKLTLADGTTLLADQRSPACDGADRQRSASWLAAEARCICFRRTPRRHRDERGNSGWLALPAVLYLTVLFVGPTSIVLAYSFCGAISRAACCPSFRGTPGGWRPMRSRCGFSAGPCSWRLA